MMINMVIIIQKGVVDVNKFSLVLVNELEIT